MNEVWDLSILYKDFDDPAFTGDMKALDEAIAAVNTLAGEAAGMEHSQLVHRFLQVQERVEELANKLFIFCSLRCSANTADTKANSLGDRLRRRQRIPAPDGGGAGGSGRHHGRRPGAGALSLPAGVHPPGQQVPAHRPGGGVVRPDEHLRCFGVGEPAG